MKKNKVKVISITIAALIIASVFAFATLVQPVSAQVFSFKTKWGTAGTGAGQFNGPEDVIVDSLGNIYVADGNNNRIQRFIFANPCLAGTTQIVAGVCHVVTWGGTLAGTAAGQFNHPEGLDVDALGNLYTAERFNNRIQKFTFVTPPTTCPAGTTEVTSTTAIRVCHVVTIGGTAAGAANGQFSDPEGVAIDSVGDLYTSERGGNRIQKFTFVTSPTCPAGTTEVTSTTAIRVCHVLTFGSFGAGDGQFSAPSGIDLDASNNLYVTDTDNQRIQKFTSTGTFLLKWGTPGAGDGQFSSPEDVSIDPMGFVYVVEMGNHRIQKFQLASPCPAGTTQIVAGVCFVTKFGSFGSLDGQFSGPEGIFVNDVYVADTNNNRIQVFIAGPPITTVVSGLNGPIGVAAGSLFIAEENAHRVLKVDLATLAITTVAGTGVAGFSGDGGLATFAQLRSPYGVAVDGAGNVFIADKDNHRIRRVDAATGFISTLVGTGVPGFSGDGGPASAAQLNGPTAVAVNSATGDLFVADYNNHRIRRVFFDPIAGVTKISTVAGTGMITTLVNGIQATAADLANPRDVAVDPSGNLLIADSLHNQIRKVVPGADGVFNGGLDEIITAVAGTGVAGSSGDGGAATSATLNSPIGIAVGSSLYIADEGNCRVRKVVPGADGVINGGLDETITTVAGNGTCGFAGDGGPATAAQLDSPSDVVVDPATGDIFIADFKNNRIRKVDLP